MWPQLRTTAPNRSTTGAAWRAAATLAVLGAVTLSFGPLAEAAPTAAPRADAAVTVANFTFTPARARVGLGGQVTWTFPEMMAHTTTSDNGFWNSGHRSDGATFVRTFQTAGTYPYHCSIHTFMHGRVLVPLTATGSAARGWHLHWASAMPAGSSVDVQVRKPGSSAWSPLRTRTTRLGAAYHPAKAGRYALRARTHRKAHTSGWSPVRTIQVS
jgi:plastocyanin